MIAAGFAHRPPEFVVSSPPDSRRRCIPASIGTSAGFAVSEFCVVIGGGQSAFESAALLAENGAEVELVMRAPEVRWLHGTVHFRSALGPIRRLLYPLPTDVGPPGTESARSLGEAPPVSFPAAPACRTNGLTARLTGAGSWLRDRMDGVKITPPAGM